MRVLTVIHTRWSRHQGGPRVQYELADEWRRLGHACDKFSLEDAFPGGVQPPGERFADKAAAFVRANPGRWDLIDCHQTDLPFPKADLRFDGLLVARSVGLVPMFEATLARQDRRDLFTRWGPRLAARWVRTLPDRVRRRQQRRWRSGDVGPSLRAADLVNVCNADEERYVAGVYGLGAKCVRFPFGLADDTAAAFAAHARPAAARHAAREVAFVGNWEPRKGSRDWGRVVGRVRAAVPGARFRFLGVGVGREYVRRWLGQPDGDWLAVAPRYDNADLPGLLGGATVSAFPSYVEGFPFGVLEGLAAGLPTVAYDAPGAREMLPPERMAPPGDADGLADKLVALLLAPLTEYEAAATAARVSVAHLRWPQIAFDTLAVYESRLAALGAARR